MPVRVLLLTEQEFQRQHCHEAQEVEENTADQALFLHGYPQHQNAPKIKYYPEPSNESLLLLSFLLLSFVLFLRFTHSFKSLKAVTPIEV